MYGITFSCRAVRAGNTLEQILRMIFVWGIHVCTCCPAHRTCRKEQHVRKQKSRRTS